MPRSDDLVPLLTGNPNSGLGWRQGILQSWDPDTGINTVSVAGTIVNNLPVASASEAATLEVGDSVTVLTGGPTWMILGKLIVPGSADAQARLSSLTIQTATVDAVETVSSVSYVAASTNPGPEVSLYVPKSGKVLVMMSANISGQVTKAALNTMSPGGRMGFAMSGANTSSANDSFALSTGPDLLINSSQGTLGAGLAATLAYPKTGLNPGLTTFTAMYRNFGNGTSMNFSGRTLTVLAL